MVAAKQNQKFPFHFLSVSFLTETVHSSHLITDVQSLAKVSHTFSPPTHPAEENKKGKEIFWFLLPRPKGADEARRLERTIQSKATTRSVRAKWVRAKVNTSPLKSGENNKKRVPPV